MALTLDKKPVNFKFSKFKHLVEEVQKNQTQIIPNSNIAGLLKLLNGFFPCFISHEKIIGEVLKMPLEERKAYKRALEYIFYYHPKIQAKAASGMYSKNTPSQGRFSSLYNEKTKNSPTYNQVQPQYNDLVYGLNGSRAHTAYKSTIFKIMDSFNNASNLGNGIAFGYRTWSGGGNLGATKQSVTQSFQQGGPIDPTTGMVTDAMTDQAKVYPSERDDYINFILAHNGGHFSPVRSFDDSLARLRKNSIPTRECMRNTIHPSTAVTDQEFDAHYLVHLQFLQAVRRACKGGIAMVAKHSEYKNAYIHFLLDGMGDLGKIAYKIPTFLGTVDMYGETNLDYVSITASELCFCARFWSDHQYNIKDVVIFYINGNVVPAPWEDDYTYKDVFGKDVYANQEAWQRYFLGREYY